MRNVGGKASNVGGKEGNVIVKTRSVGGKASSVMYQTSDVSCIKQVTWPVTKVISQARHKYQRYGK